MHPKSRMVEVSCRSFVSGIMRGIYLGSTWRCLTAMQGIVAQSTDCHLRMLKHEIPRFDSISPFLV